MVAEARKELALGGARVESLAGIPGRKGGRSHGGDLADGIMGTTD